MSKLRNKLAALLYHARPTPGKIEVVPTKNYSTQRDLALAYSPGVAAPCLEIEKNPDDVYKYTSKGNLVAVITNGTAVLGLGDIGPLASKPVMEGKGLLFKIFADIDVFDIEINEKDPKKFIEIVKGIAPTFGGINLEDIKAPEAFEIETTLKKELDIPVMHDDQHGTAIISAAGLINALEVVGKKVEEIQVVVSGAGAAAVSCTRLYNKIGVKKENILMVDSKGVIRKDRENLTLQKKEFATSRDVWTLAEAMEGADMFLGLSIADIVTPNMLKSMAKKPIVFALANPNPEISYDLAMKTRDDILMATGRSDHPNQVNNVLGFPYIFRGAMDVKATGINEEMKIAAVHAIANLAKESVPEHVNITYNEKHIEFGRDYIIPKPFDTRLGEVIPVAVAKAAVKSGIAKYPIEDWETYQLNLSERLGSGNKILKRLSRQAKHNPKRVVFPEADHIEVLKAAQIVYEEGIAKPILLGKIKHIRQLMKEISFEEIKNEVTIIDPKSKVNKAKRFEFAEAYWKKRKRRGVKLEDAQKRMKERNYYATMMVNTGEADTLISGFSKSYPDTIKPILELIGKADGVNQIAATNLMITSKGPLFLSDTAINESPTAEELVSIARLTRKKMRAFGIKTKMAFLSFSNFGSSTSPEAKKMSKAVKILHQDFPELLVDGEVQADFALNKLMMNKSFPFSNITGHKINALIFPNLASANISYKLLKEISKIQSIGPIIMGLRKPVHLVQLGASVDEIVNMTTIAVVDKQAED